MRRITALLISIILCFSLNSCSRETGTESRGAGYTRRIDMYQSCTGLVLGDMTDDRVSVLYDGMGSGAYLDITCIQCSEQDVITPQLEKSDIWTDLPYFEEIDRYIEAAGGYAAYDFTSIEKGRYTMCGRVDGSQEYERSPDALEIWTQTYISIWDEENMILYLISIDKTL